MRKKESISLIVRAMDFAAVTYAQTRRRYTNEPYINHAIEVAKLVGQVSSDPEAIAAGLLHDCPEECGTPVGLIGNFFGVRVARYVAEVTPVSIGVAGTRAERKALDREHYAGGCPTSQTIKLADVISNSQSLPNHDPKFAMVYLPEQKAVVEALTKGHPGLRARANQIIDEYFEKNKAVFKLRQMVDATRPEDARNN